MTQLDRIRENEKKSHIEMYTRQELYHPGSWLSKPVNTALELLPYFDSYSEIKILDLGCGVGRNSIPFAQYFSHIPCAIDCVDILDMAIDKLHKNAAKFQCSAQINGIAASIDTYPILENLYDCILAISALEHMDSKESLCRKLTEIRQGLRDKGIVCIIMNSNIEERNAATNTPVEAQFEINLPTEELLALLSDAFQGDPVLKSTVKHQCYDIPRGDALHTLSSDVVTFVVRK